MDLTDIVILTYDTIVVGSGCAAFNAADWLYDLGQRDIAIVTESISSGTSRNTGSDKQTYYKLSIGAEGNDSVREMAETLYSGGGVDGGVALAEAACSVQSFMKLVNLGVQFPRDEFGQFAGYKTDHDPRQRATSAGPLTSKYMTEALEESVRRKNIKIFDRTLAIKLIVESGEIKGLLCIDINRLDQKHYGLFLIRVNSVIWCTGGPSGCYYDSVYPGSQRGMSGCVLEAGAKGANLQEWQYGLASVKFRWNVSGTYQQVLPRYISIDENGVEREFLLEELSVEDMLERIFLKGYQWPFDVTRLEGSSKIDMLVYKETILLGRRVYMDFRNNPSGLKSDCSNLFEEGYSYLEQSGALSGTPVDRLEKMNPLAVNLYLDHGIDLHKELLEIRVCAQHHNGGILVDSNWQTSVKGLYTAGEVAGTFGKTRPGGSALNSTQVGSMRAAEHIAYKRNRKKDQSETVWSHELNGYEIDVIQEVLHNVVNALSDESGIKAFRQNRQKKMSAVAAQIRNKKEMESYLQKLYLEKEAYFQSVSIRTVYEIPMLYRTYDMVVTQIALLDAMILSAKEFGSRGSHYITDQIDGESSETISSVTGNQRIVTAWNGHRFTSALEAVEGIPQTNGWFENVWAEYRERVTEEVSGE